MAEARPARAGCSGSACEQPVDAASASSGGMPANGRPAAACWPPRRRRDRPSARRAGPSPGHQAGLPVGARASSVLGGCLGRRLGVLEAGPATSGVAGLGGQQLAWVPSATIRPSSSSTTRSARLMVDSRWAMMSVVRPVQQPRSASWISCSTCTSTALVASSRMRIGGFDEQRAGDRDPLALPARQRVAALADHACRSPSGQRRR